MTGKEIIRKLEREGWRVLRQSGSHMRLGKDAGRTSVPVHGHRDLKAGTVAAIERQTGVKLR